MKTTTNKRRSYINNVPVREGEISIVTSRSAVETMKHSSRLGADMQKAGMPVLLLNCGMSDARFKEYFFEHHKYPTSPHIVLKSSVRGDLVGDRESINQIIY